MTELRPYLALLGRYRPGMLAGTLLIALTLVAGIGLLATSGWFITATGLAGIAIAAGMAVSLEVYIPSGLIRFFAIGRTVARYAERLVNHAVILRLLADLRGRFFRWLTPLDPGALARFRSADLLNRITADIDTLDGLYLRVIGPTVAAVVVLAVAAVAGAVWAPAVVLPVVAWLAVAGLGLPALAAWQGHRPGQRLAEAQRGVRTLALDAFSGLAELRIFGGLAAHRRELAAAEADYRHWRERQALAEAGGTATATLVGQLGVALAAALGIVAWERGDLTGPGLGLVVLGALGLAEALTPLPGAWFQLGRTRAAARRLNEVAASEPVAPDPPAPRAASGATDLALEGVTVRWLPHAPPLLEDLDWRLPAGETALLGGPSGVGKSTVAALFARLVVPDAGTVRLGGVPVAELAASTLYRELAVLTQRSELFADTIAGNLRIARPDATIGELWRALAIADLAETVAELPDELETWVGEGGARLSGGQARRLALARVVLRDAPVVILDEPTTGLEAEGCRRLAERLGPWLAERTALVVTHEPARLPLPGTRYTLHDGWIQRVA